MNLIRYTIMMHYASSLKPLYYRFLRKKEKICNERFLDDYSIAGEISKPVKKFKKTRGFGRIRRYRKLSDITGQLGED